MMRSVSDRDGRFVRFGDYPHGSLQADRVHQHEHKLQRLHGSHAGRPNWWQNTQVSCLDPHVA
jgi:hypothetical protein